MVSPFCEKKRPYSPQNAPQKASVFCESGCFRSKKQNALDILWKTQILTRGTRVCVWTNTLPGTSSLLGLQLGQASDGVVQGTTVLCAFGVQYKLRYASRRLLLFLKLMRLSLIVCYQVPIEKLVAWSETANRIRQTQAAPDIPSNERATWSSVSCGFRSIC